MPLRGAQLTILPVKAIVALSTSSLILAQIGQVIPSASALDGVGRLTLDGALVVAVMALWRALNEARKQMAEERGQKDLAIEKKDAQMLALVAKVTENMVLSTEGQKEMRAAMVSVREAVDSIAGTRPRRDPEHRK